MKITDGLELSAKKVEYLKYLSGRTSAVKTNHLAIRFGVDPSTITKTISELAESGYLTYTPYHGVCLSKKGRQYAEFLCQTAPDTYTHADPFRALAGTGLPGSLPV